MANNKQGAQMWRSTDMLCSNYSRGSDLSKDWWTEGMNSSSARQFKVERQRRTHHQSRTRIRSGAEYSVWLNCQRINAPKNTKQPWWAFRPQNIRDCSAFLNPVKAKAENIAEVSNGPRRSVCNDNQSKQSEKASIPRTSGDVSWERFIYSDEVMCAEDCSRLSNTYTKTTQTHNNIWTGAEHVLSGCRLVPHHSLPALGVPQNLMKRVNHRHSPHENIVIPAEPSEDWMPLTGGIRSTYPSSIKKPPLRILSYLFLLFVND